MPVRVSTDWTFRGLQVVLLENELLRAVILPQLGGKLWQLTYKPADRDLLWQHPRLMPRPVPFGATYDDVFFGGWDELFPNDMPEVLAGEQLPDHGEIWTLPWSAEVVAAGPDAATVRLAVETPISAARLEKTITLRAGEARLRFGHTITSLGRHDQPFLWKLHAAMALGRESRIALPARSMYVEDFGPPRNGATNVRYTWPFLEDAAGLRHDMRRTLPADAGVNEFQYATELDAGWCAITHPDEQLGFGLAWERDILPSCWLFATYGGWRNLHTVILEPCTGYPIGVAQGVEAGTHQVLRAGQQISCAVVATVFTGTGAVRSIDADGAVELAAEDDD